MQTFLPNTFWTVGILKMTVIEYGSVKGFDMDSQQCNLDTILERIGQFGKFQIRNYALIIPPMMFNAYFMYSYIFVASSVVHRCRIPECDGSNSGFEESWTNFTIPTTLDGGLDKCYRYAPYNRSSDICVSDNYDRNAKESCGLDLVFRDNETSISRDFDIYCSDEWKLSLVGTVSVAGQFIGAPVGGFLSDRYGRRTMIALGGFLSAILGLIRSFSSNYFMFLALAFVEHVCGGVIFSTLFIIALELVNEKARTLSGLFLTTFYSFGEILLAIVAKNVQNWRWILRIAYTPALAHIALLWLLPESVRWLLSRGDEEKAAKILHMAAKTNKRKLSNSTLEHLFLENRYQLRKSHKSEFPIKEAFNAFPWRIMNCSLCWFSNILVFHGLNLNSATLKGNKYDNFVFSSLVEVPANIILYFTMNRFGRRYSLFGYLLVCGICLVSSIFISNEFYVLLLFLVGKMAISLSLQVLFFFTSEIFPTTVRNSLLSFCLMFGKIGSMVAPQTALLAKYNKSAPSILFSGFAIVAGCMALLFPETTNVVLPSTLNEAEEIGHEKNKK